MKIKNSNYQENNNCINEKYDTKTLIIIFFLTAFIGWLWEVFLELALSGILVNKGIFIGPYLPIYGFGIILILLMFSRTSLKKFSNNRFISFFIISIICTLLEFGTSVILEKIYGMKWWDYSNYWLNFNGRISIITSFIMGVAGSFGFYIYAPSVRKKIKRVNQKYLTIICCIWVLIFSIDFCLCYKNPNQGIGITENIVFNLFDNN